jgi:N-acetylmuramoyl-L-alanine amidase
MMKKINLTFIFMLFAFVVKSQTIVIDPGHGYFSDGSSDRSDTEILTNMAVANKLNVLLQNCSSITTYLTRSNSNIDNYPTPTQRRVNSNGWNADRFLSVHCNAGGGDGTETFWCDLSNSSISDCTTFAYEIQNQMVSYGEWNSRRVAEYDSYLNKGHLGVLNGNNAIGSLNEIGFVDNSSNSSKLLNDSWRGKFAQAYYVALENSLSFTCNSSSNFPDLVIEEMWTEPSNPQVGEEVDLYVRIKNVGGVLAENIRLEYFIDNNYIDDDTHSTLNPNEEREENENNYVFNTSGVYRYCVYIDAVSNEQETLNNSYCIDINIENPGGPEDIFLTDVSVSPTTVNAGGEVTAYATMNYSGSQLDEDLDNFKLDYYISTDCNLSNDDIYLDDDNSSLGSDDPTNDENQDLTIPANTASGTYYILFFADADDELNESNENNNIECIQITVSGNPGGPEDIFLTNVSVSPTTVNAGGEVTAYATMNYSGSQLDEDLDNFKLDYYISTDCNLSNDDIYLDDDTSSLGSDDPTDDENQDLTIPANTPSGTHYILFVADADDELNESNENNNIECVQIMVNDALSVVDYEFQNQITIYPNPSSDLINISSNYNLDINKLYVYDLNGRLLKTKEGNDLNKLNISELTNGIYLLKIVNNENKQAVFRIVKE